MQTNQAVDISSLILRLFIAWRFLTILQYVENYFSGEPIQIAGLAVTVVGGLLILLGLFSRWAAIATMAYFIFLALIGYGFSAFSGNLYIILILVIITILGSGKYSLDYYRSSRVS